MKYKFYKEEIAGLITLGALPEEEKFNAIFRLSSHDWTPKKNQVIVDEIERSKTRKKEEEYIWANEDVTLYANEHGVFLIDEIAIRHGEKNSEKLGLELTHEEFISFMKDFKKFIEENQ